MLTESSFFGESLRFLKPLNVVEISKLEVKIATYGIRMFTPCPVRSLTSDCWGAITTSRDGADWRTDRDVVALPLTIRFTIDIRPGQRGCL